jgi:tRNA threonylcarbamoyladenosine biosynthesis protein TsaE
MTRAEVVTSTPAATEAAGAALGAGLRRGDVISLDGPLGAGKTVFVRGLAAGLGLDVAPVRSPTFVFHHVYGRPPGLHHIDLYRLGPGADTTFLDLDSLAEQAPIALEWGGWADLSAWPVIHVEIVPGAGDERRIVVSGDHPAVQAVSAP